ncbi:MAG: hypothetical protein JKY32_07565 [Rhizobiales bacterium]|nr:hypothetical protein [Hyphomicrobiales bacterium]
MVDLVITAASVLQGSTAQVEKGTAGATITAGQVVYLDATDNKYKLADTDSVTAAVRVPVGIALNGAADGQPLSIVTSGDIVIGATMTAATAYYLSGTPGGIAPVADLATGDYPCILGMATSTTLLNIKINCAGVAL